MLICGVLGGVVYVVTDLLASSLYPGYSFAGQAVSELFAIGAPTSRIVVPFFSLSSVLIAAFGLGLWSSPGASRAMRAMGLMMIANAADALALWNLFPMHMRGSARTFTDTMHIILSVDPFVLLSLAFAIAAFEKGLRTYTIVTVLTSLLPAIAAFSYVPALEANDPTPRLGLLERFAQYAYMAWMAVVAVTLLRKPGALK
ncbi:MAG: DUF998 domain-containing protein [Bacillota bacterium]